MRWSTDNARSTASHAPLPPTRNHYLPPQQPSIHLPPPPPALPRRNLDNARQAAQSHLPYAGVPHTANDPPQNHPPANSHLQPNGFGIDLFGDLDDDHDGFSAATSDDDLQDFVTLEDSDDEEGEGGEDMPAATRRRGATAASRRETIVDLTAGSTPPDTTKPPSQRGRKRSADSTNAGEGRATKRKRSIPDDIEEIDLSNEAPSAEEELLKTQQQEAIKAQQAAHESAIPVRIGKRQCIICMENYTDCTATACGHFYCHECLIQALMAGARNSDRGTGTCPVCRKPLSHTAKKKTDIIPISFMTKGQYEKQQGKKVSGMA